MPFVTFPTGQDGLGSSGVEGGLILPLGAQLPWGFRLGFMTEFDAVRDNNGAGARAVFVNSVTCGRDIAGGLAGYVEFFSTSEQPGRSWIGTVDLVTAGSGTRHLLPATGGSGKRRDSRTIAISFPARRGGIPPAGRRPHAEPRLVGGPVQMRPDAASDDAVLLAIERGAVDVTGLAVGLACEAQDGGVVDEPIGDGDRLRGRRQELGPLLEREIRRTELGQRCRADAEQEASQGRRVGVTRQPREVLEHAVLPQKLRRLDSFEPEDHRVEQRQQHLPDAVGSIPTRHLFANETYFHLLLLAYNLVNWFKRLCLPPELQAATLQTPRQPVLLMPAQLVRTGNRPRLVLPASGAREAAWKHALHRIDPLKP